MNFVSLGPSELSVLETCPYYRVVRIKRFDCIYLVFFFISLEFFEN